MIKRLVVFFNKLIGRTYLINHGSKEVHDLNSGHVNCHILDIKNKEFCNRKKAIQIMDLSDEYNGCRWCNKKHDKG